MRTENVRQGEHAILQDEGQIMITIAVVAEHTAVCKYADPNGNILGHDLFPNRPISILAKCLPLEKIMSSASLQR